MRPFRLSDLLGGIVRPNKKQTTREILSRKLTDETRFWIWDVAMVK